MGMRSMSDLLVIGAGQLGRLVANTWKSSYPESRVTLKFRSLVRERKQALEKEGFTVISQEEGDPCSAPLVVFCAPPTGNPDYVQDIRAALDNNWNDKGPGACFLFTSSGSVFAENSGGEVDESSEVIRTARSEKLVDAEGEVLARGGCVLRLGGLYPYSRDTMEFYRKKGAEIARPRGLINQVHYEDAASSAVRCLENPAKVGREIFLVSDGVPMTKKEVVSVAVNSYGTEMTFSDVEEVDGKVYNIEKIRKTLNWKPKHPSFKNSMMQEIEKMK